jgi:hypothetical protein
MRILICSILLLLMILTAGCQPAQRESSEPAETGLSPTGTRVTSPADTPVVEMATPDRSEENMKKTLERVTPGESTPPVTGEAPSELLDSIKKDLVERTGASLEEIVVIQDEAVVWNDGSLGCAQPGKMYTQALVSGYRVVLAIGEQKYDYRAAENGHFIICENGLSPISPRSTPTS